ncbi:receptor-like protein 12, partial [Phalaenopsis equestris]|uniref:receptor-like protein 12 n=1 Tax=Phalaenopsis equestris TaxID=78828 RepID=UPI0009E48344
IPRSIFKLSGLQRLHLDSNNFSGVVGSEFIKGLKDLGWLSLSNNKLTEIPLFIKYQNNSFRLELSKNKLTGAIPTFFCNLTNLELLDLSDNKLIGSIPPCLLESSLESLAYLNYSSNNLTGEIPTFICNLNQLQTLDLSNNKINGSIPPCLLKRSSLKALSYLDLSKNKLIGEIPTFICNLTNLEMLDLSDNKLTGSIPSCLFEEESSLLMLNLRGNQLYGAIPHGVTPNCKLQLINLRDNQLEGLLPRFLSNCRSLELLDLGNNNLKDVFPYWLGNISTLRVLILRSNKFYGLVGPLDGNKKTNYTFSALNVLDISSNKFSGNLSVICFSNFKSMMINPTDVMQSSVSNLSDAYYSLVVLTIMDKGQIMMIQRFWTIIKSIDISNNYFEGEIPISIGELVSLQVLNLSQNHLIGKILPQLEHLLQLESLDLSMNNLSGKIPQELVSLHFLSFLNLSYNKLVGEIPSGGQFSTFSSASFEGNKGLCWHPCNTSVPAVNNKVPSLGDTASENKSYKIVLGLLFGVGLGGSMAAVIVVDVMCCDRSRRWRNIRQRSSFELLSSLNYANNNLTEEIPTFICNLTNLQTLDLSNNKLNGYIPPCLLESNLSVLNLSYNKLVGEIPSEGQFSTFPSTSFEGNKGLCRHPCIASVPMVNNKAPSTPSLGGTTSENKSYKIVLGLLFFLEFGGSMVVVIVIDVMFCGRSRRRRRIRPSNG